MIHRRIKMGNLRNIRLAVVALLVVAVIGTAAVSADSGRNFVAHLSGGDEVPPNASLGQGQAFFQLSPDGSELHYRLTVANIDNVVASHIHVGPAGINGPVVVPLFGPAAPGGGGFDGVLAEGTITAANLTGPLAGQPLSALLDAMAAGGTYVNVHTNDGIAPVGTGPGDLPGGEIRGQIH
jgi:hypothetical protein